jgi:signal transduction histidine kinase
VRRGVLRRAAAVALVVAAPFAQAAALNRDLHEGVQLGLSLLLVVWLCVVLARVDWRERRPKALLLAGAATIAVVMVAVDLWVLHVRHDSAATPWGRYVVLGLLAVLAWRLVDGFRRSGAALRRFNRELQERIAQRETELRRAFEGQRANEREQAVLTERDRILREMHDGLGGRLVAAMALTSQVARLSEPPPGGAPRSVDEPLRDLQLTLDDCLVELRLALDSLETEPRPLVESLAEMRFRVEPSLRAAGVRLVWQVAEAASEVELSAPHTLHVLRIVREALTNVIKHAQASVTWLRLESLPDGGLALSVVDNGLQQRGGPELPLFVPASMGGGGRGLANMRRRAAALGARFDSGPCEEGWAVRLALPAAG